MAAMLIRGITCSVGYGPLLAVTLARNMRHLAECLVVTSPDDETTHAVASSTPGVRIHATTAWTDFGALCNKGLALETGFDILGRHGIICIFDADILLPPVMPLPDLKPDRLYGCRRRILEDPGKWHPGIDWRTCPYSRDGGPIGYFQLFAAEAPALQGKRPWYDVSFGHAGGSDAYFMSHWTPDKRTVLGLDVLHLGPTDRHWFGLDQIGTDMMARFVHENRWSGAMRKHSLDAVKRAKEVVYRVEVPGYPESDFELPFVKRTNQGRQLPHS
jgi:hypothetical protein